MTPIFIRTHDFHMTVILVSLPLDNPCLCLCFFIVPPIATQNVNFSIIFDYSITFLMKKKAVRQFLQLKPVMIFLSQFPQNDSIKIVLVVFSSRCLSNFTISHRLLHRVSSNVIETVCFFSRGWNQINIRVKMCRTLSKIFNVNIHSTSNCSKPCLCTKFVVTWTKKKQSYGQKKLENFLLCHMRKWAVCISYPPTWLLQYGDFQNFEQP